MLHTDSHCHGIVRPSNGKSSSQIPSKTLDFEEDNHENTTGQYNTTTMQ